MIHDSDEAKRAFALELIKNPNNPFQAALVLFPNDTGWCLRMAREWINDPIVVAEKEAILEKHNELDFLPGKVTLCRAIWERMNGGDAGRYVGNEDFVKLAKLYAEVMDFVPKTSKIDANVKTSSTIQIIASALDEKI